MSFPNPDNYARDCDCGTAGANTTPPPASLVAAFLPNPLILPLGGSIDTRNLTGVGGSINTSGDNDGAIGGSINTSAYNGYAGGSITTKAAGNNSGGLINTAGGDIDNGGSIDTSNGGGAINTFGSGSASGGSINTSSGGGSINTQGVGSIQFGIAATRTTLNGSATAARTVTLPNITGTLPIALISASTALNFGSISTGSFVDLTIPLTGAQLDDWSSVNCVSIRGSGDGSRNLIFSSFVSAVNIVTVRAHNPTAGSIDPNSYNFKVAIIKTV